MFINLHLGIHKTASTFQQEQLLVEFSGAQNKKITYIPLETMRGGITKAIRSLSVKRIKREITPYTNTQKLIISDENIIGNAQEILSGNIYHNTNKTIEKIRQAMPESDTRIFISLRNSCDFMASIYCEYLRFYPFMEFRDYMRNHKIENIKWSEIFREAITKNSESSFSILNFDNYEKLKDKHLKELSFGAIQRVNPTIKASRKTLTEEAINLLSRSPKNSAKILKDLEETNYIHGQKFSPFTKKVKLESRLELRQDLYELSKYKNVNIID